MCVCVLSLTNAEGIHDENYILKVVNPIVSHSVDYISGRPEAKYPARKMLQNVNKKGEWMSGAEPVDRTDYAAQENERTDFQSKLSHYSQSKSVVPPL